VKKVDEVVRNKGGKNGEKIKKGRHVRGWGNLSGTVTFVK